MVITELLTRNAQFYGDEVALVEINPSDKHDNAITWRDYELIESNPAERYRRESAPYKRR